MRFTGPLSLLAAFSMTSLAAAQPSPAPTELSPLATDPAPVATDGAPPATEPPPPAMEPAPPKKPGGGLTNKKGGVVLQINAEMNLTKDKAWKPVSIAPDLSVGITDALTVAIEHSSFALTGFRGSAGSGLCITGKDNGCGSVYRQGGAELIYSVSKGATAVAIDGGIVLKDLRPASTSTLDTFAKIGAKGKFSKGVFSLMVSPSLWIGLSNRSVTGMDGKSTKLNKDQLWFPVVGWVKPIPSLQLGIGSGIKGALSKFADVYTIPIGALAQLSVNKHVQVGASFIFGQIAGGDAIANPEPGADARVLQLWLTLAS